MKPTTGKLMEKLASAIHPKRLRPLVGALGGYVYGASVPADRAASDYTARVIPLHSGVAVPLESNRLLWQR